MKKMMMLIAAGALALAVLAPGTASAGWRRGWGGPGVGVYVGPPYGYAGAYPAYGTYPSYGYSYGYPYAYYPYWRQRHYWNRHYGWY